MSLFILILPVIGLMERHGLRERAEILISKINAATAGRIFMIYLFVRQVTVAFGINMSGMVAMVRPLIAPMSEAAVSQGRPVSQRTLDKVRGVAASADNIGNFFGQNLFLAAGGLLLIKGVMEQLGYSVELTDMVLYGLPTAICAYIVNFIRFIIFDKTIQASVANMLELIYKMQPLDYVYLLVGIILFIFAIQSFLDKEHKYRIGTGLFWLLYSISFIFGSYLSKEINGWLVIAMAAIVLVKQLGKGHYFESSIEFKKGEAVRIGNVIFVPALLVGIITFFIGFFTKLGALVGLGIAAIIAMCAALFITKGELNQGFHEGRRLIDAISWTAILSQLLAALGYLFNLAGVGKLISSAVASVVPADNVFLVVVAYCIGMVIFTMIMGNAFAAFAMITSAIGIPMLVVAHGANPAAVGAIAMLAGYCGTLMTPMAANFNIVPVALLEMRDQYGVIKAQLPIALIMLVLNILLMYYFI